MKRHLITAALAVAILYPYGSAVAATPVATLGTGPGTYTVNVTADSGTFAISRTLTRNPVTTGGCINSFRRKPNGQQVYLGTTCSTAGTIQFSTSLFVACETSLDLTVNGVVIQSWLLHAPCPPPTPPAIVATYGVGVATFTNPANVDQTTTFSTGVTPTTTACTTSIPAHLTSHFAGIGINRYLYLTLDGDGYITVPAQSTVTVTWTCT